MTVPSNANDNQQPPVETKSNDQEINFAKLRKQLESERQAKQQLEERLNRLEQERYKAPEKESDDYQSDEPYVDHRLLDKRFKNFEGAIDQKIEKKAEERARALMDKERQENFLKQNPDFFNIVSNEYVQKFAEKHPEIAEPMLEMPDNFARQKLLYQNIKALGVHKKEEPAKPIQETINQNRRSAYYQPSGVGTAPYAGQGDFSQSGQKSAYEKLQQLKKNMRLG